MSDYTPTTEDVREAYAIYNANGFLVLSDDEGLADFDRWKAANDAEVRAKARSAFADELTRVGVHTFDIHEIRRRAKEATA